MKNVSGVVSAGFARSRALENPAPLACWLIAQLLATAASCTPIADVKAPAQTDQGAQHEGMDAGARAAHLDAALPPTAAVDAAAIKAAEPAGPTPGDACTSADARGCAVHEVRTPVQCEDAHWTRQESCAEDERCETAAGPDYGRCVPIATECVGRRSGEEFCDDKNESLGRVCNAFVPSTIRTCADQQRCSLSGDHVSCVCALGLVGQAGGCQVATDCAIAQGGCDPHTRCSMSAGERVCGPCPAGFSGDGKRGCAPLLSALRVSAGELTPAFAPDVASYRLRLPLLRQRVQLSIDAAADTTVEINGARVAPESIWTSPLLPLGQRTIALVLTSPFGVSNRYELSVERAGVQEAFVKASRPDAGDTFGYALAVSGDTMVVGAVYEDSASGGVNGNQADNSAADSGAAYVFVRQGSTWIQQAYLKADAPAQNDFFGVNVAVWGDTIAVSATRASPYGNISSTRNGYVYVFARTAGTWSQQARLEAPDPTEPDLFGFGLAFQQDRLVVGAPFESSSARRSGAAYVYTRTGNDWGSPTKLKAAQPTADAYLGWSVAVDGDTVIAGAHHDNQAVVGPGSAGTAHVFVRSASGWAEQQTLQSPNSSDDDLFGWSVTVSGDTAAVGAPHGDLSATDAAGQAFVFERSGTHWAVSATMSAPLPRASDYFGTSVVLASDALVIGASGDSSGATGVDADFSRGDAPQSGALYVYGRQDDGWVRSTYLKAAVIDRNDLFAKRVVVDGDMLAVSAIDEASGAMGVNGDAANNSAGASGAVYVFR